MTAIALTAVLDTGEAVPLTECTWVQVAPCGCVSGATIASSGPRVYVTPETACKQIAGSKKQAARDVADGFTMRLVTTEVARTLLTGCTHRPRWGVPS